MKSIVIIVCTLILIKPIVPLIRYVLDYDYIANELCVNKQKKELHCNGKCFLMKQLAKASEGEKPAANDKKNNHWDFEVNWFQPIQPLCLLLNFTKNLRFFVRPSLLHPIDRYFQVFRPPIVN